MSLVQNEVDYDDAVALVQRGVTLVLEGANMPTTNDAIGYLHDKGAILAAAKACNAGGVAVSGLEMAQNATMTNWSKAEVDRRLEVRPVALSSFRWVSVYICDSAQKSANRLGPGSSFAHK